MQGAWKSLFLCSEENRWTNENQQLILDTNENWRHRADWCPEQKKQRMDVKNHSFLEQKSGAVYLRRASVAVGRLNCKELITGGQMWVRLRWKLQVWQCAAAYSWDSAHFQGLSQALPVQIKDQFHTSPYDRSGSKHLQSMFFFFNFLCILLHNCLPTCMYGHHVCLVSM